MPALEHAGQVLSFKKPQLSTTPLERLAIECIRERGRPLGGRGRARPSRLSLRLPYRTAAQVVVVWPGEALAGPPVEVARELNGLGGDHHDGLDHTAAQAIRQFLTDPAGTDAARWSSTRTQTWSIPAVGHWLSGPANQPGHHTHTPASQPGAPTPATPIRCPTPAQSRPSTSRLTHNHLLVGEVNG